MSTTPQHPALSALRELSLADVEQRLAEIDAERAGLALIRRSLMARERSRRKSARRLSPGTPHHDEVADE
ncbi:MAG: hypothetical protein GX621_10325 [Pirellulaceae bacterium]|nr:hypothetical protein [Pirellulaceae bacterium]